MAVIGISGLFVRHARVGGAESMLHNLLFGLSLQKHTEDKLVFFYDSESDPPTKGFDIDYRRLPSLSRNRFIQESVLLPWFSRDCDTLLFPNYFMAPMGATRRSVTIIHDLQYRWYPRNFRARKRRWLRAAHEITLCRSFGVVTLSEFTKRDILSAYGSRFEHKLHVIPNPVSWQYLDGAGPALIDRPYVLSVAAHYPHKNLSTLIRAFSLLRNKLPEFILVLVGQTADNLIGSIQHEDLRSIISELGLERRVILTGFVDGATLGSWYRHASLFVFPSLFEGFGMPAVEALGLGIPVLCSRCGSLEETTQGKAVYLHDPASHVEMAEHMFEMATHPSRYRPDEGTTRQIRSSYSIKRIGRMYYDLLTRGV